jgi:Na+-transporting NADH:ubiquinone oxidoreductase subunit A
MALHSIKKGLTLPIKGAPEQRIAPGSPLTRVALLADDYIGMRPTLHVQEGQEVQRGQLLFEDKKIPGVLFTSPGAGKVIALHRGARRAFQSAVIELNERERQGQPGAEDQVRFESYTGAKPESLSGDQIKALLIDSGQWTALRARPFGRTANPRGPAPHSIFVTAMDTNPLAPSVEVILGGRESAFQTGVAALAKLTEGKVFVCQAPGANIPLPPVERVQKEEFAGIHPAGIPGVHIHTLDPVCREKTVWYIGLQDVAAIGKLLTTGKLDVERIVSLAGPSVKKPRLIRTRLGAFLDELTAGELAEGDHRIVSGSVFSGRKVSGEVLGYLGRYHQQISVLPEGHQREFLGWMAPGGGKFSTVRAFLSGFLPKKEYDFTTNLNGSRRAIIPIGLYEKVMPMDLLPTFLLRSLAVGDVEQAERLGCLELEEEDLALCTFVCPGKADYGPLLREALTTIEKEG